MVLHWAKFCSEFVKHLLLLQYLASIAPKNILRCLMPGAYIHFTFRFLNMGFPSSVASKNDKD